MHKIIFAISIAVTSLTGSFMLRQTKANLESTLSQFQQIFSEENNNCIVIPDSIYHNHAAILPPHTPADSLHSLFLSKLFDGVCYIDDYGIDKKTCSISNGIKTLSFYSAKNNGYHLIVTFSDNDPCILIINVEGLSPLINHKCRM